MKEIRIGVGVADSGRETGVDALVAQVRAAEEAGFQSVWLPNIFNFDSLTLAAIAGRETKWIELGTAVAVTHSRHPYYMAQQAASTSAACGKGRFALGLGPSHQAVIENMMGLSYEKPALHVREYLEVLAALLEEGKVSFAGRRYRVNAALQVSGARPFPVLLGGLGPLMRKLAGRLAHGTITWMTGPRTLGEAVVPDVRAAAEAAGRPAPRIVAGFPVCLTEDADGARKVAGKLFAIYGTLPSYRAMLDHEGVEGPGDIAIVGDEREIEAAAMRLASAGVTDWNANVFPHGPDREASVRRTTEFLSELAES
jgi:5,10-methylenetetrahydromethanopterin reductase